MGAPGGLDFLGFCLLSSVTACSRSSSHDSLPAQVGAAPQPAELSAVSVGDGGKSFGALCTTDAECAGDVCFHKRLKIADAGRERRGSNDAVEPEGYCSLRCNGDDDCPVPPTRGKCGARGMCKRPD